MNSDKPNGLLNFVWFVIGFVPTVFQLWLVPLMLVIRVLVQLMAKSPARDKAASRSGLAGVMLGVGVLLCMIYAGFIRLDLPLLRAFGGG